VISQFTLGGDGLTAEDIENGEVFFLGFHWVFWVFVHG